MDANLYNHQNEMHKSHTPSSVYIPPRKSHPNQNLPPPPYNPMSPQRTHPISPALQLQMTPPHPPPRYDRRGSESSATGQAMFDPSLLQSSESPYHTYYSPLPQRQQPQHDLLDYQQPHVPSAYQHPPPQYKSTPVYQHPPYRSPAQHYDPQSPQVYYHQHEQPNVQGLFRPPPLTHTYSLPTSLGGQYIEPNTRGPRHEELRGVYDSLGVSMLGKDHGQSQDENSQSMVRNGSGGPAGGYGDAFQNQGQKQYFQSGVATGSHPTSATPFPTAAPNGSTSPASSYVLSPGPTSPSTLQHDQTVYRTPPFAELTPASEAHIVDSSPYVPQRRFRSDTSGPLSPTSSTSSQALGANTSTSASSLLLGSYIPPRRHTIKLNDGDSSPSRRNSVSTAPDAAPGFFDDLNHPRRPTTSTTHSSRSHHHQPTRFNAAPRLTPDDLLEQGNVSYSAQNFDDAMQKWKRAAEMAAEEGDLIMEAKAHSNWSCALRVLGAFEEALLHVQWAWRRSCRFVDDAVPSPWVDLITHYVEISEVDAGEAPSMSPTGLGVSILRRHVSVNSGRSEGSSGSNGSQALLGPPIVVWFMELASNYGNAVFCTGDVTEAIQWHEIALRLAEAVLDEFNLPQTLAIDLGAQLGRCEDWTSTKTMPRGKIKFSYVHRSTLLALVRSLTHIGVCYQYLSKQEEAFHCQTRASQVLQFYLAHNPRHASTPSIGTLTAARRPREVDFQTKPTQGPVEKLRAYAACVFANLGMSYYARDLIPVAMDRHVRSARMFADLEDGLRLARQKANVRLLEIEAARRVGLVAWGLQNAYDEGAGRSTMGPPRLPGVNYPVGVPDERVGKEVGIRVVERGLVELGELADVFVNAGDFLAATLTRMNMGATLTVVQQPQQAFHVYAVIAASLEKEPTPRMPSGRSAVVIGDLSKHKLPKWLSTALYLNMYINVAQLERIQFENSHDNNFIPRSHNDLYPGRGQDVAYVKSLFQLLDNSVELPEFENLTPGSAEVIESSVQEIVRNFVESTRDWSYETGTTSLNVPVVEEDHVNDDDAGDEIGLGVHTSVMRGWDHPPRLSGCKAYATSEVLSTAKDKCVQGIRLLQWHPGTHEVGTEYIRDGLNKISTLRVGSRNATERVEWVVEGLERLLDESGQGNGLGQSSLIALVADIVGYGCVYAPELLELFGIETEVHGQEVRRLLVRGSAVLSAAALGVCEGCMAAIVSRVQAGGEDLGRLYVGLGSLESSNPSGGWPCEHFPSQYFVFR